MNRIDELMLAIEVAEAALLAALADAYPIGCKIVYRLRPGVKEQTGTVIGHIGGREGNLRVRLATGRHGGKPYETTMPVRKIIRRSSGDHGGKS